MSDDEPEPRMRVGVFRPDDDRLADAVALLESLGATPVPDPMLAVDPTGQRPRGADYVVFTSKTGVEIVAGERPADGGDENSADGERDRRWEPDDTTVVAIGASTADALRERGYPVDVIPAEYSSTGLVDALAGLQEAVVGAIGDPTRETAEDADIAVDVVPGEADFEALACEVVERAAPTYHE